MRSDLGVLLLWLAPLLLPRPAHGGEGGDPACWVEGFSRDQCCGPQFGPRGNEGCWDAEFTFERCCGSEPEEVVARTSLPQPVPPAPQEVMPQPPAPLSAMLDEVAERHQELPGGGTLSVIPAEYAMAGVAALALFGLLSMACGSRDSGASTEAAAPSSEEVASQRAQRLNHFKEEAAPKASGRKRVTAASQ
mmetsp:Transcript_34145/g.74344  ORF Transcript_34145/g.74344 Transcript_34145/m.74344 type:complete len:192 (+) Transcript_34145:64-639(+)